MDRFEREISINHSIKRTSISRLSFAFSPTSIWSIRNIFQQRKRVIWKETRITKAFFFPKSVYYIHLDGRQNLLARIVFSVPQFMSSNWCKVHNIRRKIELVYVTFPPSTLHMRYPITLHNITDDDPIQSEMTSFPKNRKTVMCGTNLEWNLLEKPTQIPFLLDQRICDFTLGLGQNTSQTIEQI